MSEDTLMMGREKVLSKILAQDLLNSEKQWLDYEHEETQVKLDIGDLILESLIDDLVDILNSN